MRHAPLLLAMVLGGCHSIPLWELITEKGRANEDGSPSASILVRPTPENTATTEFAYVPAESNRTSREDLFRLIDATNKAYEVLNFKEPYPLIRIVDRTSESLSSPYAIATAVVTDEGKEIVYFNRYFISKNIPIEGTVIHEYAHFATWRRFGHDVPPHGREFWAVCSKATKRNHCRPYAGRFG
ncbi:MAG: SprT-like domain-containing protein [Pseudomonadota bacterium]